MALGTRWEQGTTGLPASVGIIFCLKVSSCLLNFSSGSFLLLEEGVEWGLQNYFIFRVLLSVLVISAFSCSFIKVWGHIGEN